MSEFQYFEWETLDRSLTQAEIRAVDALSSHIEVSARHALVTYDWGDFKHDPLKVLLLYFDAFLYFANWGSRQLAFRFPHGSVDAAVLTVFLDGTHLSLTAGAEFDILNLDWHAMEPGEYELDANLSDLAGLRRELQQGDLRGMYIAWLATQQLHQRDDATEALSDEPPVPPGLQTLTAAQQALVALLELDPFLVQAAAESSAPFQAPHDDFAAWLDLLPATEQRDFLLRLARGEPALDIRLAQRLRGLGQNEQPAAAAATPHTLQHLQYRAETLRIDHDVAEAERQERERIARLTAMVGQEEQLWQTIDAAIADSTRVRYAAVVDQILALRELAQFRNRTPDFTERLAALLQRYPKRQALRSRLHDKGLI